jgi:hypothetical protein
MHFKATRILVALFTGAVVFAVASPRGDDWMAYKLLKSSFSDNELSKMHAKSKQAYALAKDTDLRKMCEYTMDASKQMMDLGNETRSNLNDGANLVGAFTTASFNLKESADSILFLVEWGSYNSEKADAKIERKFLGRRIQHWGAIVFAILVTGFIAARTLRPKSSANSAAQTTALPSSGL